MVLWYGGGSAVARGNGWNQLHPWWTEEPSACAGFNPSSLDSEVIVVTWICSTFKRYHIVVFVQMFISALFRTVSVKWLNLHRSNVDYFLKLLFLEQMSTKARLNVTTTTTKLPPSLIQQLTGVSRFVFLNNIPKNIFIPICKEAVPDLCKVFSTSHVTFFIIGKLTHSHHIIPTSAFPFHDVWQAFLCSVFGH